MAPRNPLDQPAPLHLDDGTDGALARVEEGEAPGRASLASGPTRAMTRAMTADAEEADEGLLSKISVFHLKRQKGKMRMFRNVLVIAFVLILTGVLGSIAARVLRNMWGRNSVASAAIYVISLNLNAWAFVVFASCISDELDINALSRRSPRIATALLSAILLNAMFSVATGDLLSGAEAPIAICAALYCWDRICPTCWPLLTTWLVLWFIIDFAGSGLSRLPPLNDGRLKTTLPAVIMGIGCIYILVAAAIFGAWLWARGRPERCSPTMLFYALCVLWAAVRGLQDVLHGLAWMALPAEGSPDHFAATVLVVRGAGMLLPPLVIMLIGRQRLFNLLGHLFDGNAGRLQRDGAFVAELLDTVPIRQGDTWWVHRDEPEERFQPFDHRRNWKKGVVVEVEADVSSEFVVQSQGLEASRPHSSPVRVQLGSNARKSREEILQQAQADLRCIEFEKLSADLMKTQDSRNKPELQAEWYALSRRVRPGERIDYFMSHSWHDDPEVKWEMIKKVAERFRARVGRYPTFWLDKVCIDQTTISDGLKVLPVNVMACAKVLLLCGTTYPTRLWCVWELFTLYAFTNEATARGRVECVFLGSADQGEQIHNQMKKFSVRHAHCYDPNEEARLRRVINAVGAETFNQRICQMAQYLQVDQEWSSGNVRGNNSGKFAVMAMFSAGGKNSRQPSVNPEKLGVSL